MSYLRNLSIRTKLLGAFGLVLTITTVLGVVMIVQIANVNSGGVYIATNSLPSVETIDQIIANEDTVRVDQLWNITNSNVAISDVPVHGAQAAEREITAEFAHYRADLVSDPADARLMNSASAQWSAYVRQTSPRMLIPSSNTGQPATVKLANSSALTFRALAPTTSAWRTGNVDLAASRTASNTSTYSAAKEVAIVLLLIAIIVGIVVALLITRQISTGAAEMLRVAQGISEGDVNQEITVRSDDELGQTAAAFASMIEYLKEVARTLERIARGDLTIEPSPKSDRDLLGQALLKVVSDLRRVIGQVASSASQVSAASQEMSATSQESGRATGEIASAIGQIAQGAEQQARMIEGVREAADEVNRAVTVTAQSAERTAEVAGLAQEVASNGVAAADEARSAMRAVRDSSREASEVIGALATKSEEIGQIVATITAIAGQTNLLALNAAIEAARAGEQGKGFAVVAEEVRKLAEESQQAASSIGELISSIQGETAHAVSVVTDSAHQTEEGSRVVEQTREAFVQIGSSITDIAAQVQEIAAASQQLAANAQSMHTSIGDVATVAEESSAATEEVSASTEETSASAQQIAASAHELSGNAETLAALVSQFELSRDTDPDLIA